MSLAEAWQNIEAHLKADAESVKERLEQDLPVVAGAIEKAANDPIAQAVEQAVHLPSLPSAVQLVVNFIQGLDSALGAAKEAAPPPAAPEAPEVPADPAPSA